MNKIKFTFNPFNMSSLAIAGGTAAIKDQEYFHKCVAEVIRIREEFEDELSELGFEVIRTTTNFTFFKPRGISAKKMTGELRDRGILVRHYDEEKIKDYIRITIGTKLEMEIVLNNIKEIAAVCK